MRTVLVWIDCYIKGRNTQSPPPYKAFSLDANQILVVLIATHLIFSPGAFPLHIIVKNLFFITFQDHFCCVWAENHRWKHGPLNILLSNHETPKYHSSVFKSLITFTWDMSRISAIPCDLDYFQSEFQFGHLQQQA